MLLPVPGSSLLRGPQRARWVRVAVLGVAALGSLLPARAALAQDADDNGWFEQPAAEPAPAPEPYYSDPAADTAAPAQSQDVPDTDPSALTTFRPALDPYGAWVSDSTYGTVWVPNREVVGEDFAPYVSRGHWALTADEDWIWQSDYPFGWAVFHYGRWVWVPGHGWAWVPGRTYANAWVVWRTPMVGYDYVGWAPMPPTWGWYNGYAFGVWYSPPLPYVFCPSRFAFDYRVHYHIVRDRALVHDIASHSHVYPTPYRPPANPSVRPAGAPGVRPAAIGASGVPHGPAMSAARVPAQAVPAMRTLPSPNATRLSGTRITNSDFGRARFSSAAEARIRPSSPRVSSGARSAFTGDVRRSAPSPSSTWTNAPRPSSTWTSAPRPSSTWTSAPRPNASTWTSAPRSSPSPSRIRVSPSSSSSFAPSSHSFAPSSHSFAPSSHSFAPSHSFHGGGSFHRR
jgi:hypothetical protein